jgi:hypothetical protein
MSLEGKFSRSCGLQAGINYIKVRVGAIYKACGVGMSRAGDFVEWRLGVHGLIRGGVLGMNLSLVLVQAWGRGGEVNTQEWSVGSLHPFCTIHMLIS